MKLKDLQQLLFSKIGALKFLSHYFIFRAFYDKKAYKYMKSKSRIYIQISYTANCVKTDEYKLWTGRKYYLSDYMTEDEIIKTCFVAFKTAVEHEILEAFKVDKKTIFNPHVSYLELSKISHIEVNRNRNANKRKRKANI